jgi:hypothetical protein
MALFAGGITMIDYRAYIVGTDGHYVAFRNFTCDTDEHAIEWAKQLMDPPIELWSGSRLVKCISPIEKAAVLTYRIQQGRMVPDNEQFASPSRSSV